MSSRKPVRAAMLVSILGGLFLSAVPTASAAAPPEAASCAACHGADGMGNAAAGYPRLAGLPAQYLADQLHLFADGARANAIMSGMARPLSAAQVTALANYYAGLPAVGGPLGAKPTGAAAIEGERLAVRGDWSAGIPACLRCHGPGAAGVGTAFPALTGQSAAYIEAQIKAWKEGSRRGDPNGLMQTVALRMTDAQTRAVAQWLAAQPLRPPKSAAAKH